MNLESTHAEYAGQKLEAIRSIAVLALNGSIADVVMLEAD